MRPGFKRGLTRKLLEISALSGMQQLVGEFTQQTSRSRQPIASDRKHMWSRSMYRIQSIPTLRRVFERRKFKIRPAIPNLLCVKDLASSPFQAALSGSSTFIKGSARKNRQSVGGLPTTQEPDLIVIDTTGRMRCTEQNNGVNIKNEAGKAASLPKCDR